MVNSVLVFLSIVLFTCPSQKYGYRKLNQAIDVNIHQENEQLHLSATLTGKLSLRECNSNVIMHILWKASIDIKMH